MEGVKELSFGSLCDILGRLRHRRHDVTISRGLRLHLLLKLLHPQHGNVKRHRDLSWDVAENAGGK